MSKYKAQGDYHYKLFNTKRDPYRLHVLDVIKHVEEQLQVESTILDVGCGEGLVVDRLNKAGFRVRGIDIDEDAVRLALSHDNPVSMHRIEEMESDARWNSTYDAILMLDVLEHVTDFNLTLAHAKDIAETIFIAVPDREDPGALRQMIGDQVAAAFDDGEWNCLHKQRRHARDFMIFGGGR